MPDLSSRVADAIVRHPWWALLGGLLLWVATLPGLAVLEPDFTYRNFFHDDDPFRARFEQFEARFGADASTGFVVHSPSGIFDADSARLVRELTDEAWQLPSMLRVDSLANLPWVHADGEEILVEDLLGEDVVDDPDALAERRRVALEHETLPHWMISPDGTTTVVLALPQPERGTHRNDPKAITLAAQALADRYSTRTDHDVRLVGQMPLQWAFEDAAQRDAQRLLPFLLALAVLFLVVSLRSLRAVGPPMLLMVLSVSGSMGLMGWAGIHVGNFTATLPQVMVAISLAGGVHLTTNLVGARRQGVATPDAARFAIAKNLFPTLVMFVTSAVGFVTFTTTPIANMGDFGQSGAMGVLATWVWLQLVLGPLLVLWPWGAPPTAEAPADDALGAPAPWALKASGALRRHRYALLGGFGLACAVGLGMSSRVTVDSDPWNYFAQGFWARDANDFALDTMEGMVLFELVADAGAPEAAKDPAFLEKVVAFQEGVGALEGVQQTVSLADTLQAVNRAFRKGDPAAYAIAPSREAVGQELLFYTMSLPQGMDLKRQISVANDALRISVVADVTGSARHHALRDRMLAVAEEVGLDVVVTGRHDLYQTMLHYVVASFVQSLGLAVVLVSLCMGVFLRSPRLALLAMVPNLVPLMVGGGLLYLAGKPMDIGTLGVGSVVLGISVDDTVHVLANFRRYVGTEGPVRAMAHVLTHTAPALVTTTLMLVAAFGALAFGVFVPNVWFGILVAACLVVALVADLTALPALLFVAYPEADDAPPSA